MSNIIKPTNYYDFNVKNYISYSEMEKYVLNTIPSATSLSKYATKTDVLKEILISKENNFDRYQKDDKILTYTYVTGENTTKEIYTPGISIGLDRTGLEKRYNSSLTLYSKAPESELNGSENHTSLDVTLVSSPDTDNISSAFNIISKDNVIVTSLSHYKDDTKSASTLLSLTDFHIARGYPVQYGNMSAIDDTKYNLKNSSQELLENGYSNILMSFMNIKNSKYNGVLINSPDTTSSPLSSLDIKHSGSQLPFVLSTSLTTDNDCLVGGFGTINTDTETILPMITARKNTNSNYDLILGNFKEYTPSPFENISLTSSSETTLNTNKLNITINNITSTLTDTAFISGIRNDNRHNVFGYNKKSLYVNTDESISLSSINTIIRSPNNTCLSSLTINHAGTKGAVNLTGYEFVNVSCDSIRITSPESIIRNDTSYRHYSNSFVFDTEHSSKLEITPLSTTLTTYKFVANSDQNNIMGDLDVEGRLTLKQSIISNISDTYTDVETIKDGGNIKIDVSRTNNIICRNSSVSDGSFKVILTGGKYGQIISFISTNSDCHIDVYPGNDVVLKRNILYTLFFQDSVYCTIMYGYQNVIGYQNT